MIEATTIKVNNRHGCKLIDTDKVKEAKERRLYFLEQQRLVNERIHYLNQLNRPKHLI